MSRTPKPLLGAIYTAPDRGNIRQVVEWSKTTHGGKQRDLLNMETLACSSAYGLCE